MKKPMKDLIEDQVLDAEEQEIEAALARGEYVSDMTREEATKMWQDAVRRTFRKKPITVRVQERDIARIKAKALEQGIPYQTLVASILHRYATGLLKEEA
jgi:predicted DNA binding CopG/RHH family protein